MPRLTEQVAEWVKSHRYGCTIDAVQKQFGLDREHAREAMRRVAEGKRYDAEWVEHDPATDGRILAAKLVVHSINKKTGVTKPRRLFHATPLPGWEAGYPPLVFIGTYAVVDNGYNLSSVRNAMDKPTCYAGYVWSSAPLGENKYTPKTSARTRSKT